MKWLKPNFFNILAPIQETKEYILYNTLNGGMELLNWADGEYLSKIKAGGTLIGMEEVENDDFLKYLYEKEYLTDISEPERARFIDMYSKEKRMLFESEVANIGLTIGTTITCNMGCPYCFQFEKPNKSLRDEKNIFGIIQYLNDMVEKAPVKKWEKLSVVWYGGEPLVNSSVIEKLTPRLFEFCKAYNIGYSAMIITNGLLLNDKNWNLLKSNKVSNVQITIDGPEDLHNKKRPLKAKTGENYKKILANISQVPEEIEITIRINVDKDVASRWDEFFEDLYKYEIWPQRYNAIKLEPSWLRPYEEIKENQVSNFLTSDEFFDELQNFRLRQLNLFNSWAAKKGRKKAKLNWTLPSLKQDCATWTSPYSIVVDPEGYIQKCWETIHDASNHILHVSDGYHPEKFKSYTSYNKIELNNICKNCEYLPVCDKLPCAFDALKKGKPDCTPWKTKLPDSLKYQYLLMKMRPDLIASPPINEMPEKSNTGHTNK